jgi:recombinational DNA repair ATPase RecF
MVIRRLEIRRFRGFEHVVIVPTGHALVVGEPRAGRPDVIEGLRRVLSADSTRSLLGDDIDSSSARARAFLSGAVDSCSSGDSRGPVSGNVPCWSGASAMAPGDLPGAQARL